MAKFFFLVLLIRIILPACLLLSLAFRPYGISLCYLLLFLLAPLVPVPLSKTIKGIPGKFLFLNVLVPFLLLILQIVWHSTLAGFAPYGSVLENYPIIDKIGKNIGLVSYSNMEVIEAVKNLAPDLVMFASATIIYAIVQRLLVDPEISEKLKRNTNHQRFPILTNVGKYVCLFLIMLSGITRPSVTSGLYYLVFMGSATAWSLSRPLERTFAIVGRCLMVLMGLHVLVNFIYQSPWISDLYSPEEPFARYFGLTKIVILNDIPNSEIFIYSYTVDQKWGTIASPLVILITYFVLAIECRELLKPKAKEKKSKLSFALEGGMVNGALARGVSFSARQSGTKDKWKNATKKVRGLVRTSIDAKGVDVDNKKVAYSYIDSKALRGNTRDTETTPLMRSVSPSKRRSLRSGNRPLRQDSAGSVIMQDDESTEHLAPTLMDEIIEAFLDFFKVLIRSSYIATTITMMAWSIMYHSWLTFVFLMWANVVWLWPNQRSFMLKTSPLLVIYAMLLLLAQYIYGMNLTEDELPSHLPNVNMKQIGLSRPEGEPCTPLLLKSLFTCMFWVTLRQFRQDFETKRQTTVLTDMAAPLQLTVSTAASVIEARQEEEKRSRLLKILGDWLRTLCARCWIYVVVIMLFVIGITGERMTIFRILYMALFLVFILMFQLSWHWWRRLMYVFWIIVIIYSMVNLILIYVYQFDKFSATIEAYLLINEKLQHDLGLEPYKPADLFVKLLTPTLFLIITVMQVHYFHKDFMALSDPKTRTSSAKEPASEPHSTAAPSTMKDEQVPPLPVESERADTPIGGPDTATDTTDRSTEMDSSNAPTKPSHRPSTRKSSPSFEQSEPHTKTFRSWAAMAARNGKIFFNQWVDKMYLFLEIHLIKIIMVSLMLLCVSNVSAIHVPIMIIITPGLLLSQRYQRRCVLFISILISVYLMAMMVYQIGYISHSTFNVTCALPTENAYSNMTFNNAEWIGFTKTTKSRPLVALTEGYIGLIAVITFYSLVNYRQQSHRKLGKIPDTDELVVFPNIKRVDADRDVPSCIKFFINYGFYKFGVEVTLICLMGVIGSRMDVYAVIYAIWLIVMVSSERKRLANYWSFFTIFITFIIPLQYMLAVGFMPYFCFNYPWAGEGPVIRHIRSWLFLPYMAQPPHAVKLIFDYFLLLFATRQLRVFKIERTEGSKYAGGCNTERVGANWETPYFVNCVPDFIGTVGKWLDLVKCTVFLTMLWVTLAIMFMTGTNRVNLFSMGYLIGSFIFFWQGTDFYLLPKSSILRWWSWLLLYNVTVVVIKTLLQIPGCIFAQTMQEHACWVVQLLGIGCVDKFAGGSLKEFIKMQQYVKEASCPVPQEDIGLAWDGVCFAFLLLQRRLFHSYYFFRVINESKATTVLASRGAELIEELRQKQMLMQEEQELKILGKIKAKMEKIKANQKKIQGAVSKEPAHHDAEDEDTQHMEDYTAQEEVPLVRGDSDASRGYHTPDSAGSPRGFHTPVSEPSAPPSPDHSPPAPPTLPTSSHGPPSPSSALLTSLSLDAYLEPRRISFGSPPSSELLPRAQSPDDSYPVFSPPPIRRRHTVASPSLLQRTSIISQSSRASRAEPSSHHTSVRSGDYYMFEELDDTDIQLKREDHEDEDDEVLPKDMGIGKFLSTAIKTDLRHAVDSRRTSAPGFISSRRPSAASHRRESGSSKSIQEREKAVSERAGPSDVDDGLVLQEETKFEKLKRYLLTIWVVVESFLISLTRHIMRYSRDYRYVSNTLAIEKKRIKEKEGFGIGLRQGKQMRWEPLPETLLHRKLSDISVPEIRILAPSMERGLDASPPPPRSPSPPPTPSVDSDDNTSEHESAFSLRSTESKDVTMLEEQDDSVFKHDKNAFVHLMYAIWYAVIAHTEIVCFLMVFINQIQSATILSIPLPLMVFLWGSLSIPRPTKTFWVTMIAYTEVIVLVKSMFQFEILPWNQKVVPATMPFTAPRIIGIERKSHYALYDLILLLIIFFHRFMLKSLGLWKESIPDVLLHDDYDYPVTVEDTQMLMEGRGEEVGRKYLHLHDTSGPRHPLVDRLYRVQEMISVAMKQLGVHRSDPRVAHYVQQQILRDHYRRRQLLRRRAHLQSHTMSVHGRLSLREYFERRILREEAMAMAIRDENQVTGILSHMSESSDIRLQSTSGYPDQDPEEPPYEEPAIAVRTTLENPYANYSNTLHLALNRYTRPITVFFRRMMEAGSRVTADVYAYMFLCDFVNFLVVIFGFAAFGTHQGDGGVQAYLEENKVPIPFLVMLILQFALIVIDRALYLRKFMLGKILFQYGLIIGVHIWMFFVLPLITERKFNTLLAPPLWYMMKCIYLLLSAYQIRCGYPRRIIGNFLCKSYNYLNMILFRGFMVVPFVFELRTLMDWIWTDTSMNLMDWLKMEDIFASVFLLKCSRYVEDEFPQGRGTKKSNASKYILGGSVLAFVIAIIWFPLVFFAFGNTVGQPNPPTDVTVKIRIGPFLPVYQMSAQSHNIDTFSEADYSQLSNIFARDRTAQTFLSNYMYNDLAVVSINPNSTMKWQISPPELDRLKREAASNETLNVKFTFVITHLSNAQNNPPVIEESNEVSLPGTENGKRTPQRIILHNLLLGTADKDDWVNVETLFPKFVKVFNKGTAKPASQLMPWSKHPSGRYYRDVQLRLERENGDMYWRVREKCNMGELLNSIPLNDCDMLVMYTFNDKLFPETLNFISGSGIIGLYTTFVFLAARVIRGFFSGIYTKIMFDDLPNVDRVLQLCLDIYLVREALELTLEEDLFAKLVFLYRSPETMIKWSRPRNEPEQRALPPP